MRQHAIPQNILDIEFKLFTKFTVREFVYMALGIGFGGIFLYFFSIGQIPGIIAFPIFLFSSGVGLFLGLVNINDQKADIFLRNYFWAITHPTQRVWRNEMIDERLGGLTKPQFTDTQANMNGQQEAGNANIIGSSDDLPKTQFIEQTKLDEIDSSEKAALDQITQLAQNAGMGPADQVQRPQPVQPTPQPVTAPVQQQVTPVQPQPSKIRIDMNNIINNSTTLIKQPPYNGNINFKVLTQNNENISNAIIVIKDDQNRVLSAIQSDTNGEAYTNRVFAPGTYNVEIQAVNYAFIPYQIVMDTPNNWAIKITAK